MLTPNDPAERVRPSRTEQGRTAAAEEDAALAEACRSGSLAAYEKVYQTHGARLKSIAANLLGSRQDAEDAVQEVFLKVHRAIGSFKGQSAFSTWIYRILINTCYDLRRKKLRRQEMPEPELETESEVKLEPAAKTSDHPLRMALETCVQQLNPNQQKVFLLFEVEGFSHAEIATTLEISPASSKNLLFQAKRHLRRMILESKIPIRRDPS